MNTDKLTNIDMLNDAIHSNNIELAENLIAKQNFSFESWEDADCMWWSDYGISDPGTVYKSTAEWIVKVTKGVKGSENALFQAEWVIILYEKEEEEQRIFQSKIDGVYDYSDDTYNEGIIG